LTSPTVVLRVIDEWYRPFDRSVALALLSASRQLVRCC